MDAGRGTIQKRTRFSFKITRAHGFEAGEYQVTIKDGRTGSTIGRRQRLVLKGENEVIDRRSMVFGGEKKKKKKKKDEPAEQDYTPKKQLGPEDEAFWAGGPTEPEEEADGPPSIEEKPGGCGCRVGASSGSPLGVSAALLALGLALATRRARG
jgi:MYXO-CTERM domain-containing protein